MPLFQRDQSPLLAVDIDGVISLFGFEGKEAHDVRKEPPRGEFHLVDGMVHCISRAAGDRLRHLSQTYELVWCSGWEDRANDHLTQLLGLPELPYLTFDGQAEWGTAHWKLAPLERYARERPLAWIDDSLDRSCYEWAERRPEPTLLVPTDPERGLEQAQVETLERWARDGFEEG
jgi:hypothetical protein